MLIDIIGLLIIGFGLPLVVWYLATQDIGVVVRFFEGL
jgi:hypothetical protein